MNDLTEAYASILILTSTLQFDAKFVAKENYA